MNEKNEKKDGLSPIIKICIVFTVTIIVLMTVFLVLLVMNIKKEKEEAAAAKTIQIEAESESDSSSEDEAKTETKETSEKNSKTETDQKSSDTAETDTSDKKDDVKKTEESSTETAEKETDTKSTETTETTEDSAAAFVYGDLENVEAGTLIDPGRLDQGNIDQYFKSYAISDEIFARIYGDDRSFKTYCTLSRDDLRYIKVLYNGFDGQIYVGELMANTAVADDLASIFEELYQIGYQINKMVLVDNYNADDDASIADNNTSAFNYRNIFGSSTLSNHAYGFAIDVNPYNNPYITYDEEGNVVVYDVGAENYLDRYASDAYERHMINYDDPCYQIFTAHGWSWGGNWGNPVDYQHFEK